MEKNGAEGANAVLEMVDKSIVAAAVVYAAFILYVDVDIVVCLLICMFKRRCVAIYFRMKIMSCHISGALDLFGSWCTTRSEHDESIFFETPRAKAKQTSPSYVLAIFSFNPTSSSQL